MTMKRRMSAHLKNRMRESVRRKNISRYIAFRGAYNALMNSKHRQPKNVIREYLAIRRDMPCNGETWYALFLVQQLSDDLYANKFV